MEVDNGQQSNSPSRRTNITVGAARRQAWEARTGGLHPSAEGSTEDRDEPEGNPWAPDYGPTLGEEPEEEEGTRTSTLNRSRPQEPLDA